MKTALIIGASDGIGYATAKLFLKSGYRVINVSRTECDLSGVENMLCDVTVREKFDEILQLLSSGRIDCFIYSAGFSMAAPLEYCLEGDYRYLFEVNLFSFIHALHVLIPALRLSEGVVCAVSSLAALLPIPFDSYYSASKSALNSLCESLSYELEPEGIKIYSVMPGGTKTKFTSKRKIYPPSSVDGYSKQLTLSADSLAKTEQNGLSPDKIAHGIFKICTEQTAESVCCPHIFNKIFHITAKLMPAKLKKFLIKSKYFSESDEQ